MLIEAFGQEVANIRQHLRDEFSAEIGQLRDQFEIAKARASGNLIELPAADEAQ